MTTPLPAVARLAVVENETSDFRALYTAYFQFVWRCLRGLGVAPAAVDDAAQEVFLVVHRRWQDFRGESSVRTWLYGIVRNVASNQRRSDRRKNDRLITTYDIDQTASADRSPHDIAQAHEASDFVQRFVATLDEKKRDVFVLALIEELSIPEVADTLGIPLNTAYTRLRNVRIEFRNALQKQRGES